MAATIDVNSQAVDAALAELQRRMIDAEPVMRAIGEDMMARVKGRFATATAPDGTPWRANSTATIRAYLKERGGYSKKTGKLLKKGEVLKAAKRPLQGVSGDLARQIFSQADAGSVTAGSTMIYAAMQHFGGAKAKFPNLWGDIPARPFMPVSPEGELYQAEEDAILETLREYLEGA